MLVVTGGAGFIGSNITSMLCDKGSHEVIVCDRLRSDDIKWRNLAACFVDLVIAPEELSGFLAQNASRLSAIVHMGAISATTAVDADLVNRVNFRLSRDLWTFCADHGVPFYYASSAATYGDGARGFSATGDLAEVEKLQPLNLYGWSKLWFDVWALRCVQSGGRAPPQWAGLRFFNVYGPGEFHKGEMMSIVAKNFRSCAAGEPVKLFRSHHPDYPDGGQLRDFVYVKDCCAVIEWLMSDERASGIFNVGTGEARTFRDLISSLFSAFGQEPNIEYIDMPETIRNKYQYFTQADIGDLREAGYEREFTSVEEGVRRYADDCLSTMLSSQP